ncbi:MAG: ABC transporter permease [Nocardioides sp.]
MSSLDLSPRSGAAPFPRMVVAQAAMEARLMLRNGEQLLLAVVIPVLVLVGGVKAADHVDLGLSHRPVDVLTPGVLALAVMSTAFTSLAIATGFERRYGVIKRLGSSPLPRSGLLAGKVGGLLVVEVLQIAVVSVVGLLLGWHPDAGGIPAAVVAVAVGTLAFAALGLLVAGTLRAEATLAAANLVYLLLLAGGAVVLPGSSYGAFGHVTACLPSGALGGAMREALISGGVAWRDLGVLVAWGVVGTAVTARTFRWE